MYSYIINFLIWPSYINMKILGIVLLTIHTLIFLYGSYLFYEYIKNNKC
jgi:hypothetical protein